MLKTPLRRDRFPSLHHRKEGWTRHQERCREASFFGADGVVFRSQQKENHPDCVASVAPRHSLDDAATPPCGDARRGIACLAILATTRQSLSLCKAPPYQGGEF